MLPVIPIVAAVGVGGLAWYFLKPKAHPMPPPQLPPAPTPHFTPTDLAKAGIKPPPQVAIPTDFAPEPALTS